MNPIFNLIWIQYRQRSSVVDGWGSITTPYGTYDCLRIKHEITETDSVQIDVTGTGIPIWFELPVPPSIEYEWISKNEFTPILSIRTTLGAVDETVTQIKYKDEYLGLDAGTHENTMSLKLGPNPVTEELFINGLNAHAKYQLISTEGKIIQSGNIIFQGEQTSLKLDGLKSGTYLIHITDGENQFAQRIIKQ